MTAPTRHHATANASTGASVSIRSFPSETDKKEYRRRGPKGAEVRFRQHEGSIIDNHTKNKSDFIKRKGVYFMKLFVPRCKDKDEDEVNPDFVRPGHP